MKLKKFHPKIDLTIRKQIIKEINVSLKHYNILLDLFTYE